MARNCRSALPRQLWSGSAPEGPLLSNATQSLLKHVTATQKMSREPLLDQKLLEASVSERDTDSSRMQTLGPEAHCRRAAGEEPPPPAARDHVGNTDQVGTRDMQSDRWEASCHSLGTPRASSQGWGPPPSLSPTCPQTHRGSRADLTPRRQHLPQPRQAGGRRGGSAAPRQAPALSKRTRPPQAPPPGLAAPAGAAAPRRRPRPWPPAHEARDHVVHGGLRPHPACASRGERGGALQRGHPTLPLPEGYAMAQGPAVCRGGSQRHVPGLWGPRRSRVGVKDRSCSGGPVQTTPTTSCGTLAGHWPRASVPSSVRRGQTAP